MRRGRCLSYVRTPVAEKWALEGLGNKDKNSKQNMKHQTIKCFHSYLMEDVEHVRHGRERVWDLDATAVDQNCPLSLGRIVRNASI